MKTQKRALRGLFLRLAQAAVLLGACGTTEPPAPDPSSALVPARTEAHPLHPSSPPRPAGKEDAAELGRTVREPLFGAPESSTVQRIAPGYRAERGNRVEAAEPAARPPQLERTQK